MNEFHTPFRSKNLLSVVGHERGAKTRTSSANCNALVLPLEPSWVRPSRQLVRVEEVTPPNSESPIVATMSDEPEIPVPPEPTTHVLKALLAQKESLNRAINK